MRKFRPKFVKATDELTLIKLRFGEIDDRERCQITKMLVLLLPCFTITFSQSNTVVCIGAQLEPVLSCSDLTMVSIVFTSDLSPLVQVSIQDIHFMVRL